ncbi:hydantoinase/oxoprolinase N-terminal domain-containing protein [Paenarthrobacter sp. YJN-5]|uniref:hydantoinase/oxoprolinase N-terminal domain-containing protein n=1 Tax=unclassified Paenarthrobacter TaxID=2634190 RepID=UPI001878A77F|nr:hydantoinase/oxoprolinase N-terminal domain-containing protein [Paenarthrobacter sp. YJN-5]QOT19958.1 methylhydantoinase [Paenarthrobacter sp. YJN-5]
MRVGLQLRETGCRTVVLEGRTVLAAAREVEAARLSDALDSSFSALRREFGSDIEEITADVGRVLEQRQLGKVLAVRISPRPPADAFHATVLPAQVEPALTQVVHVTGGHDLRGRPLARLDLEGFLADLPALLASDVRNVAITSVGSTASKDHETRIADAILSLDSEMRISISSDFFSSVFRDRDYTAILNSSLMESGEELVAMLETASRRYFPQALLSFAKNDGGRSPLPWLTAVPVHGLRAETAMGLLGAATLAGVPEGEVILSTDAGVGVGRTRKGLPVTRSLISQGFEAGLASNSAILEPFTVQHAIPVGIPSVIVDLRGIQQDPMPFGLVATLREKHIALVGSAVAPLTAWIDRLETFNGPADLQRVQNQAEEDARSAAVQLGVSPEQAQIIESNVFALPYGNPGIVRVRVQAAGDRSTNTEKVLPLHRRREAS